MIFISGVWGAQAQTDSLRFPINGKLPSRFNEAVSVQTKVFDQLFFMDSTTTRHYPASFMLDKIDNDSNHYYLFLAEYWIAFHYSEIIPELIKRVTQKKEVGLTNYADLIIWDRVLAGQMKSFGHGGVSRDDLFTVAGRANRLLTIITGEDFGHVSMYSTPGELKALQDKWIKWLIRIQRKNHLE